MLAEFVTENRDAIITMAQSRVAARTHPVPTDAELKNGIPRFLDQLVDALQLAVVTDKVDHVELGTSAGKHGADLLALGLTIGQVVHDYGDVCQAVTQLITEHGVQLASHEFRTLNLCLDDAIAEAVTEYARQRERSAAASGTERLGILAHELLNALDAASLAFTSLQSGRVGIDGSTGKLLGRSLIRLRNLVDRSMVEVRIDAGIERREIISVAELLVELEIGAELYARTLGLQLEVTSVDRAVYIAGDRQIVVGAVSNLLQNALKFTHKPSRVSLTTSVTEDRVLFEVEDECGGLPEGKTDELFVPFEQRSADRSGVGLGLSIAVKAAKATGGEIRVRNLPGKGCVFTLDLPRYHGTEVALQGST